MASDVGMRVAEVILLDRDGEGVWSRPESLALYLVGSYLPGSLRHEETQAVAAAVLADLDGEGRFRDVATLAAFLDEEMARVAALP